MNDRVTDSNMDRATLAQQGDSDLMKSLLQSDVAAKPLMSGGGVVVGRLLGFSDNGCTPLVFFDGQLGLAAVRARTIVDLHARHIGQEIVLAFEQGLPSLPVVMGVLRGQPDLPLGNLVPQLELDVDGQRTIVSAAHQLVLRCGKSSITLRNDGTIEIVGESIVSQAREANRIRGGSVQLN